LSNWFDATVSHVRGGRPRVGLEAFVPGHTELRRADSGDGAPAITSERGRP